MTEFSIPLRVYLEDTDAGGIVYYVNYLKYMERARTEWLRALGFDFQVLAAQSFQFVVHSMQIDYKLPAKMDDQLTVTAKLQKQARSYLVFQQRILKQGEPLCVGQVKVACVDAHTLKPMAMPDKLINALEGDN